MKIKTKLFFPFFIISMLAGSEACLAILNYAPVMDSNQNFVRDNYDNCVRTKWLTLTDLCAEDTTLSEDNTQIKVEEHIQNKVYFAFDRSDLSDFEKEKLLKIIKLIDQNKITGIKISGYTDRIGTNEYDYHLSLERAKAVSDFINIYLKPGKYLYKVKGLGKTHEIKECSGIQEREALIKCLTPNRRVEIEVIIHYVAKTPDLDNLNQ